jgi:cell division topological specificity factor
MGLLDIFFGKRKSSATEAKKRLTMVLEYERKQLPPNFAELLKQDLVSIFSKYPQFDVDNIEVELRKEDGTLSTEQLWISIPFKESRR